MCVQALCIHYKSMYVCVCMYFCVYTVCLSAAPLGARLPVCDYVCTNDVPVSPI